MNASPTPQESNRRSRRNVVLAVVHALLALAILGGFVLVQTQ